MTIWKDHGDCGRVCRGITNEEGSQDICRVWTKREVYFHEGKTHGWRVEPWPEGEANFRLILQAPQMLAALEEIADLGNLCEEADVVRNRMEEIARTAIAAVKGENDEKA